MRVSSALRSAFVVYSSFVFSTAASYADGPADNIAANVRSVPPLGIEVPEEDRKELEDGLKSLDSLIRQIRLTKHADQARINALLPDVEIFSRAVHQGLEYREFFSPNDIKNAKFVLHEGMRRASQLVKGEADWLTQKGLVVRGFRSKIDQTVQPYGLVIPDSYDGSGTADYRLDLWFHGRGEKTSESAFIAGRMRQVGQFAPKDTIVLHSYGRYSNAFKFAGEVDVLEGLAHAKQHYRVDEDRIAVRGFSMGGAGCWQMAVHYPDLFFAANPGAGFSETPEFLKFFQKEELDPTWYEKKLWQLYDCTEYAVNLAQLPTVAYSGELDTQKQAADIMEEALAREGISLTHLIGPGTKHAIHADSAKVIEAKLAAIARRGRERMPHEIRFATCTLKYNRMHWLTVTGMSEHWKQAHVNARLDANLDMIELETENVTGLKFSIPPGRNPFDLARNVTVVVNGQSLKTAKPQTDWSWTAEVHLSGDKWVEGTEKPDGLRKRNNLQGPIDDAFMDSFVIVRPTGTAKHEAVQKWTTSELKHTVEQWRKQFRGDAVVKDDTAISEQDIASSNLVLFGDASSNAVLAKIIDKLPVTWNNDTVRVGNQSFEAAHHAPILIYPNPLNPDRYVVLNSGFTYREFAYLNNARQVPKLPDWAVIDLRTPADSLWPGKVVAADFFDESWKLKTPAESR
ncbi:MAG: prolyl oligopeptidase family serine peptidase [Rhodopirellula sp.]|nr:prolyl oligopeptidase family serine peptidase [Rhodopirellula sp.]